VIILLTPAMLANDIVTAARYKIAKKLRLPVALILAEWVRSVKGGLHLEFKVDLAKREMDVSDGLIRATVQTVWNWEYKRKLEWTLENAKSVRPSP
jgi:hypothetical protein